MRYVIKNNQGYIKFKQGSSPVVVKDRVKATGFPTRERAMKRFDTLPKNMRIDLIVEKGGYDPQNSSTFVDNQMEINLNDTINDIQEKSNEILMEYNLLKQKLKEVENSIEDIEHFGEFYNVSASEGYKLFKKIQDLRRERRQLKNGIELIDKMCDMNFVQIANGKPTDIIEAFPNRKYQPRVEKELFERKKQHV